MTEPAAAPESPAARPPCPAPADMRREAADYDRLARVAAWDGPRYRMTYRVLGDGPPLILVPGLASTYRGYALVLNRLAPRFQTIVYDYPAEDPGDGSRLGRIRHADLVDDVFGLIDHLRLGRAFLFGVSFGSTITLAALHREPRRFPRAAVQGAFACRRFTVAERLALRLGRLVPGRAGRLPLRDRVLTWNNRCHFPAILDDRWSFYLEQNAQTSIAGLAHRLDLLATLDLCPILPHVPVEILLIQGNEDRIVSRSHFDELTHLLPRAQGLILPTAGHQPHFTHAELLARAVSDFLLPCSPTGCPRESGPEPPSPHPPGEYGGAAAG